MQITLPPAAGRLLPTTADLVARAIADTDFMGDLTPRTMQVELLRLAAEATDRAIDAWEAENGLQVGSTDVALRMVFQVRRLLVSHARAVMRERVAAEDDARADALQAGDITRTGEAIPYPTYRSV